MIQFYSNNITDTSASLEEDEFHHCCKVLRHKVGDIISISDGQGTKATAIISDIKKRAVILDIKEKRTAAPKTTHCTLAVAPPKNRARWEWLLEKAVEIGVDTIIPLITQRTERSKLNLERSNKIVRSAALQSLRAYHPQLSPITNFKAFMADLPKDSDGYIAHYSANNQSLTDITTQYKSGYVLIGPEGDFTEDELSITSSQGIKPCNISEHRLRTETAAVVAVNLLKTKGY